MRSRPISRPKLRWCRRAPTAIPIRQRSFRRWAADGGTARGRIAMDNLVLRENRGGAAILTLNRPQKLNALNKETFEALEEHANSLARETRTIGLVIIRG